MALTIFKLQKFTILGYRNHYRIGVPYPFEAQFNPTEVHWKYGISWNCNRATNSSGQEQDYQYSSAPGLSVTLIIDGTNVDSLGIFAPFSPSVDARIELFKKVAYMFDGTMHEPPYLTVAWGGQKPFDCRLRKFTVKYTLFDRDGTPLRAEIAAEFIEDLSDAKRALIEGKTSPDLTHARVVHVGDTLPLLTKDIYGSSDRYLDVARYNGLDHFRRLVPGQELLFPPLAVFESKGG